MRVVRYDDPSLDVTEAALEAEFGLPQGLMAAIRTQGEKSNSDAVSPKGAKGVYQFIPSTWRQFAEPGSDPRDPDAAALAAARYLRYALDQYGGDVGAAAAEYNGGPKAAQKYLRTGDPGNNETRDYLKRVLPAVGAKSPAVPSSTPIDIVPDTYSVVPMPFEPSLDVNIEPSIDLAGGAMSNRIASIVDEVLNA